MKALVELSKRARREAFEVRAWWRQNRTAAPHLFEDELADALVMLQEHPEAGTAFPRPSFPKLRKYVLQRTRYHVYFEYDADKGEIYVHSVWSSVRGTFPPVRPRKP